MRINKYIFFSISLFSTLLSCIFFKQIYINRLVSNAPPPSEYDAILSTVGLSPLFLILLLIIFHLSLHISILKTIAPLKYFQVALSPRAPLNKSFKHYLMDLIFILFLIIIIIGIFTEALISSTIGILFQLFSLFCLYLYWLWGRNIIYIKHLRK